MTPQNVPHYLFSIRWLVFIQSRVHTKILKLMSELHSYLETIKKKKKKKKKKKNIYIYNLICISL